jgi:hypothetical protein
MTAPQQSLFSGVPSLSQNSSELIKRQSIEPQHDAENIKRLMRV